MIRRVTKEDEPNSGKTTKTRSRLAGAKRHGARHAGKTMDHANGKDANGNEPLMRVGTARRGMTSNGMVNDITAAAAAAAALVRGGEKRPGAGSGTARSRAVNSRDGQRLFHCRLRIWGPSDPTIA